jgi:hypothetical protein
MKKLHKYTLDELGQELTESALLSTTINEDVHIADFESAVRNCNGISGEEFLEMWIQDIKKVGKENGYI